MTQITTGIRGLLSHHVVYEMWSRSVGGNRARAFFVATHVQPRASDNVLDLGCGTGELADHLPAGTDYLGIDMSEDYIMRARARLQGRATFRVDDAVESTKDLGQFHLAVAYGLLHHLDDCQVLRLFRNVSGLLAPKGRLVTADPTFTDGQSRVRQALMRRDRGQHIRTPDAYTGLAHSTFTSVAPSVYHDLLRIPYSHCILECEGI
jgi:2-polyprenyl-3-methyl-5-hydroxy-6-metoxy-1,4-benzoquinol methylase